MKIDPVHHAAGNALQELLEVSPQVDAAVILERDSGGLIASAPGQKDRTSDSLGGISGRILDAAEQARQELGREPVSQIEVSTPDGHVFVVADATHVVAAVTSADPTVGLVFYDLKTALRSVREARAGQTNGSGTMVAAGSDRAADDSDSNDGSKETTSSSGSRADGRWRRKKS